MSSEKRLKNKENPQLTASAVKIESALQDLEDKYTPMPWEDIEHNQVKLVVRVYESLTVLNFSTKSLK